MASLRGLLPALIAAVASATAAAGSVTEVHRLAVVAPAEEDHLAWAAAAQLQRKAKERGLELAVEPASLTDSGAPQPGLFLMPVRSLATQVPALQVLELPFFYPTLEAVHTRLDGALGEYLTAETRRYDWEIVAYWDEGMHIFSGLKRYDRVRNLKAREFLITRPDPVAERQFQYWKADARRIDPQDRQAVLRECLIASRAATMQTIMREQLYRVHLAMSLTYHRYEGWVVVAPAGYWMHLDDAIRKKLTAAVRETTLWQRNDAQQRELAALAELKQAGMTIYATDAEERGAFRRALPEWAGLLPVELGAQKRLELIEQASAGATTVIGVASGAADARSNPAPGTEARQGDQRSR
jgi:C4-dicarboxylate-binding protein DctP